MYWALFLCLLVPAALAAPLEEEIKNATGDIWAVLVAGSNGWDNYRHQADVCHAYQIFHRHGVPKKHIIVFMYDDIAYNTGNPYQGEIINQPNGTNVYKGVSKDYTGSDVTPANFLAAITGNSTAANGKKVLASGPDDHVFIYFSDHGASGELCFPDYDCTLYADDLNKALEKMHENNMYKKLLFYLEACEGGSMFDGLLPSNIDVVVTTASSPDESSYAYYCDNILDTCLGDEYSVAWMENTDSGESGALKSETIQQQFKIVKKNTPNSHPQMYGQKSLKSDKLIDFIGYKNTSQSFESRLSSGPRSVVNSRDVLLHNLNRKIKKTNDVEELKKLNERKTAYLQGRKVIDDLFSTIMSHAKATQEEINSHFPINYEMMPCYKTLTQTFRDECVNTNQNGYVVAHHYKLANLCLRENNNPKEVLEIFSQVCTEQHKQLSGIN